MIPLFIVLSYTKNQNTLHSKSNGEYRTDSLYVPPCEHPAYMGGCENDTLHIVFFKSMGRKICISVFIKNVQTNFQRFVKDTCCRDSLFYTFLNKGITKYECVRLVHSLYDCKDSLLSKKVVIFYNKDFVQSNFY